MRFSIRTRGGLIRGVDGVVRRQLAERRCSAKAAKRRATASEKRNVGSCPTSRTDVLALGQITSSNWALSYEALARGLRPPLRPAARASSDVKRWAVPRE